MRYVDDTALAAPKIHFNELLAKFNAFHPRFKFTIKVGDDVLNFLD